MRRSRRLQRQNPEYESIDQVCFICQQHLDVGSLTRCQTTPCCRALLHRSCLRRMRSHSTRCGNCQTRFQRVVNERVRRYLSYLLAERRVDAAFHQSMRERSLSSLQRYRTIRRHERTHNSNTAFWNSFPYEIPSIVWWDFYRQLEMYLLHHQPEETVYINVYAEIPVPRLYDVQSVIYRLVLNNTPLETLLYFNHLHFRYRLIHFEDLDRVRNMHFLLTPFPAFDLIPLHNPEEEDS